MGRGRQKAKATRQAREMKYYSPGTDLHALERELGGSGSLSKGQPEWEETPAEEEEDPYADYADRYSDDGDEPQRG